MTARRALALVGLALFAAGLLVGFLPLSTHVTAGRLSCGHAFSSDFHATAQDDADAVAAGVDPVAVRTLHDACTDVRQLPRMLALALLVAGGVLGVGAAIPARSRVVEQA